MCVCVCVCARAFVCVCCIQNVRKEIYVLEMTMESKRGVPRTLYLHKSIETLSKVFVLFIPFTVNLIIDCISTNKGTVSCILLLICS